MIFARLKREPNLEKYCQITLSDAAIEDADHLERGSHSAEAIIGKCIKPAMK